MTQSECATRCGVGRRHFQKIEAGQVNPPLSFFQTLSQALDARPCYFLNSNAITSPLADHGILCVSEVLDLMPTPVFVSTTQGELIYQNKSHQEFFGVNRTRIADLFNQIGDKKRAQELLTAAPTLKQLPQGFQCSVLRKDQAVFPAQITWSILRNPDSQEISGLLGVITPHLSPIGT